MGVRIGHESGSAVPSAAAGASSARIACATGYIQSDAGFYATAGTARSYQSIHAPIGGLYVRSLRATTYNQVGSNSGASGDSRPFHPFSYRSLQE